MRGINSVPMKGSRKTVSTINPTAAPITIQRCPIRLRNKLLYPNNWIPLPASLPASFLASDGIRLPSREGAGGVFINLSYNIGITKIATNNDDTSENVTVQAWSLNNSPDAPCR